LVIEQGKIIQRGSHQDLIQEQGLYQKLSSIQSV
jgi:subfamily B ATP-binding cassette protein MsbA